MLSRHLLGLLALLEASSAYVQVDFQKVRLPLSQLPSRIRQRHLDRRAGSVNAALQNAQGALLYLVNVTIGSDKQEMAVQLDTGSSDIWVPSVDSTVCASEQICTNGAFDPSSSTTYNEGSNDFNITYADGTKIFGNYFQDSFTIGGTTVNQQTMALATDSEVPQQGLPFQGIIGVGYASGEAVAAYGGDPYPNIINTLKSQGHISTQAYSLWLNDLDSQTGSILFGGVDSARYTGGITVLPIQPDAQSETISSFTVVLDNINVESGSGKVQYSQNSLALPVLLDSGTSLTYLPQSIYDSIANGVGARDSREIGTYVPCNLANSPATINFGFGNSNSQKIQVSIGEFVIPFTNEEDGGDPPQLNDGTLVCQWGIQPVSEGDPVLFGDTFLRSAYVVYDIQNNNIGIAQTKFNVSSSDSNVQDISNSIPGASTTANGASATQSFTGNPNRPSEIGGSASATGNVSGGTATFDLSGTATAGSGSGSGSGSGGSNNGGSSSSSSRPSGAAGIVAPPSASFVTAMSFGIAALSGVAGALMILL